MITEIEGIILSETPYGETSKIINTLGDYIAFGYSQIIEYDATKSRGIWYYPFSTPKVYDDTTKEGVIKTIEQYKKAGFNEIIIYLFVENECLFDSTMYKQYHKLSNYNYGEYGNDYLKCFIEECHKRDILVNAFTQTFHGYVDSMKNKNTFTEFDCEKVWYMDETAGQPKLRISQ